MEYQHLRFEKKSGIGYLTLNRPDKLNALSAELMAELRHALDVVLRRHEVDRDRVDQRRHGERRGFADVGDELLEMPARDVPDVESREHCVAEADEAQAEAVLARLLDELDEAAVEERPELARGRARRHAGAPRDLVRPERACLGEDVEDRRRASG